MLLDYETKEISSLKEDRIYFCGNILEREENYRELFLNQEKKLIKNLDDEEGYYNVLVGDHLFYRYEIIKILGKGSFALVASCVDHKTGEKVAIKVTRNTELDHKFALSEESLLTFLMEHDPEDSHNIVRMINKFYFRDHHCFAFELLKCDLYEYLKENGFAGFDTGKIREFAI